MGKTARGGRVQVGARGPWTEEGGVVIVARGGRDMVGARGSCAVWREGPVEYRRKGAVGIAAQGGRVQVGARGPWTEERTVG
eukprot:CAMPEP_0194332704 /NCGR_PEP_ID=MMETSP0171-20130528/60022_1 /TAXON_ID=218684 /ORGANISM="Corethron pennatum, Strain L29A3" /LENGTH=81 /DNA_ID=CAMNT_0039094657 /DNA_START=157 /DNA_END=398 /DNA_ORIENTATION=-